jgi:hypothetical protein
LPFVAGIPSFVGYTTPVLNVQSCLQKRSYAQTPQSDGQEQLGVSGRLGGEDITIGSLATVDVDVSRQGWLLDGAGSVPSLVRKVVVTEGDNLRRVYDNGLVGSALTNATRGDFLTATGVASREPDFVIHRAQFNDFNLLAWCVNAWRRHPQMATFDRATFMVSAPGSLVGLSGSALLTVPITLESAGYSSGFNGAINGRQSSVEYSITRTELTNANDDGDTLEIKTLGWYIAQKFGWNEQELDNFYFTPFDPFPVVRSPSEYSRFFVRMDDIREWADAQGLQYSIFRSGIPWKPVFRATNDIVFRPPDQFDSIQFLLNDGTNGEADASENAMLVSTTPANFRVRWDLSTGTQRNAALVRAGFSALLFPTTQDYTASATGLRDHSYINLDATA